MGAKWEEEELKEERGCSKASRKQRAALHYQIGTHAFLQ